MKIYDSERKYMNRLSKEGIKYVLQPKRFKLKGTTYAPDFFLPETNTYIELVGSRQAYHKNKHKYKEFRKTYPNVKFKIVGTDGEEYENRNRLTLREYIENMKETKEHGRISKSYKKLLEYRLPILNKILAQSIKDKRTVYCDSDFDVLVDSIDKERRLKLNWPGLK